jgi:hypothetical protein
VLLTESQGQEQGRRLEVWETNHEGTKNWSRGPGSRIPGFDVPGRVAQMEIGYKFAAEQIKNAR